MRIKASFAAIGALIVVIVVALSVFVYEKQESSPIVKEPQQNTAETLSTDSQNAIAYTLPSGWRDVKEPEPYTTGTRHYLASPEYKEGEFSIESGAAITFRALEWVGIGSSTTVEQAVTIIKNGEGGYLDPASVHVTAIDGKRVVMFNSGHTADCVAVLYKTESSAWLETDFCAATGGDAKYNAQESQYYGTFLEWLPTFLRLN